MAKENLLQEFINKVDQSTLGRSAMPIKPTVSFTPLIPAEKWSTNMGALTKKFMFMTKDHRNVFIEEILKLEENCACEPALVIRSDNVTISLMTKNVQQATDIDKEFARACDLLYKNITI